MVTIAWKVSYLQEVDYEVYGDGPMYRVSVRWAADTYFRSIYNGDEDQWQREIVAGVRVLHTSKSEMVKPEVLAAFRAMEHYHIEQDGPVVTGYFNHDPAVRTWVVMPEGYEYRALASHESWEKHYRCYWNAQGFQVERREIVA